MDWIRFPNWPTSSISSVWKALLKSMPLIREKQVWKINDGSWARIITDPWNGSGGRHLLSEVLIQHLNSLEIKVLADIVDPHNTSIFEQCWKFAPQINLPPHWHHEWTDYINALSESHIRIKQGPDELIWHQSENGIYTPKMGYYR